IEYATAQLLLSWGIRPAEMIGHSLGEYTAACIAGVFSLQDALAIVVLRGRLFQQLEAGTMLSIPLAPEQVRPYMDEELSFAAINKPDHCVVSGSVTAIDRIKSKLNAEEIHSTRLHIKVAAHSHMIDPILVEFGHFLEGLEFSKPQIPIVSNLSGTWVGGEEVQGPEYWKNHLRQTVRFSDGIETILNLPDRILLEVGPGQTLSTFARQHPAKKSQQLILAALKHPKETIEDTAFLLKTIGTIWCSGSSIDWNTFNAPHAFRRTSLPTYPFEKKSYWLKAKPMPFNDLEETTPLRIEPKEVSTETQNEGLKMERKTLVLGKVKDLFHDLSGIELAELYEDATFLELGFDSLFLTQATAKIKKTFKVKIGFRQLFEEAPNLESLAEYIDQQLPAEAYREELQQLNGSIQQNTGNMAAPRPAAPINAPIPVQPVSPFPPVNAPIVDPQQMNSMEGLFHRQLQIMEQQLALLRGGPIQSPGQNGPSHGLTSSPQSVPLSNGISTPPKAEAKKAKQIEREAKALKSGEGMAFGPWKPIDKKSREDLTEKELRHLDDLVKRYTSRTKGSQSLTQSQRLHLSDPRAIVGFNRIWKDMVYQIAIERSKGAHLWDVDGNKYVDYRMAFGISLFGHTPDFVQKAVMEQLEKGTELGILTPLAKKVADLLCELSGMDRATLVNTGSEAISAALRAARTVTGKELVAVFEGDYHGIADEMLVKGIQRRGETVAVPIAPGIPQSAVKNVLVLDYDDPQVLDKIKAVADDLAAVIIEPVQPNNPHRQYKELLHAIREITIQEDIALIFDEMITGFRVAPRGAQQWFDIEVDIIAYGKIISGGLPMAAVAGKARFMDAFDGGQWQYGDDSYPEAGVTFFGGTFVKHPLSLAAAYAALSEIKKGGQDMYDALNLKTAKFAERLKQLFVETQVPLRLLSTASVIAIKIVDKNPLSRLFFYYLRLKGIHIKEKAALLSTAHSQEDLNFTYQAMKESIEEMLEAGFFRPVPKGRVEESIIVYPPHLKMNSAPQKERLPNKEKKNIPLTEGQKEVWVEQRLGDDAAAAYTLSSNIRLEGDLNWSLLQKALQMLVDRHEALRTIFDQEQTTFRVRAEWPMDFPLIDLSDHSETEQSNQFTDLLKMETEQAMDIFQGPLFRAKVVRMKEKV
ncbi:MAG: aminotransferase class III-fold pyridoxal phosphate-dependent enzyme, partial [Bacteroidota bacterium]